jgi:aminoglycoside phosphotransferase (APT) family kinase protein
VSPAAGRSANASSRDADPDDIEPAIQAVLERTLRKRVQGPYSARSEQQVHEGLERLFAAEGYREIAVTDLRRLAGGASKEMFCFSLYHDGIEEPERLVLRMDPLESIIETSRRREAEILRAMRGTVPVPEVRYLDHEGEFLGQSGVITSFVPGVTKPSGYGGAGVTGLGTDYGSSAARIAPQFLKNLVAIHDFDWRAARLPSFTPPSAHPKQAALWQANWYLRIWEQDAPESLPLASLMRRWLRENAPGCLDLCVVHADYRMGNFMFDERSGEMTAVLDWELAHIGDFHEDVAYVTQKLFGLVNEKGKFLCCGLFSREEFLDRYQELSGRAVDPEKLRYYEVLNAWKSVVHTFATCVRVAKEGNNHQDILLSWLASVGHVFVAEIAGYLGGRKLA